MEEDKLSKYIRKTANYMLKNVLNELEKHGCLNTKGLKYKQMFLDELKKED